MGARVIACASSAEKVAFALQHGASEGIDYSVSDLRAELKRIAPDGVDVDAFPRVVEARLVRAELFATHFAPAALLPLGERGAGYVIYSKR